MVSPKRRPGRSPTESSTASPETSTPHRNPNTEAPSSNHQVTTTISSDQALANLHRAPINPGEFRNKCRFCPSTFAKSEHLKRHERSHTKERPYICAICDKKFTRGDSLTRHLRLHENGNVVMDSGRVEEGEEVEVPLDVKPRRRVADPGEDGGGSKAKIQKVAQASSTASPRREEKVEYSNRSADTGLQEVVIDPILTSQEFLPPFTHTSTYTHPSNTHNQYSRSPLDQDLALDPALSGPTHGESHESERNYKRRRISESDTQRTTGKLYPGYEDMHHSLSIGGLPSTNNNHSPTPYNGYTEEYLGAASSSRTDTRVPHNYAGLVGAEHRPSITLSDLYAGRTHGESVRSTYQHEWSSRSQTGEHETGEEDGSGGGDPSSFAASRQDAGGRGVNGRVSETGLSASGSVQQPHNTTNLVHPSFDAAGIPYPSPQSYLTSQYSEFPQQQNISSMMYPTNGAHMGMPPTQPHTFTTDRPYAEDSGHGMGTRDQGRMRTEVEKEIEIANANSVYGSHRSPLDDAGTTGSGQANTFPPQVQRQAGNDHTGTSFVGPGGADDMGIASGAAGYEGMDLSSFSGFDFSSPSHLDLLRLLASDGSLAFGHTLIPQYHTYTRRNSPVLEGTSSTLPGEINVFEVGESAFPGTQLAKHPHMEIDVHAWTAGEASAGQGGAPSANMGIEGANPTTTTAFDNLAASGDFDLSQFGVSMDIAQFWSGLMGHGQPLHLPSQQTHLPEVPAPAHGADNAEARSNLKPTTNGGGDPARRELTGNAPPRPGPSDRAAVGNALERHADGQKGKRPDLAGVGNNRSLSLDTPPFSMSGSLGRPQEAINEARCLITDLSFNLNASTSPLSSGFLDLCLTSFFTRFLPTFNVVHRPTFSVRQAPAPLLINMIALGSLYVPSLDAKEKGEALWRLVYKGVGASWDRLMELRNGPHDHTKGTPLVQTIMLGQLFAALSSKQSVRRSPFTFQGLGLRIARLCGMYLNPNIACDIDLPSDGCSEAELDIAWRTWAARETQLRALLGSMVVDGQFMSLFHTGTTVRHLCNEFPASCPDALWNAVTAVQWRDQVKAHTDVQVLRRKQSFASVYRKLLDEQHGGLDISLHYPLPTLGKATLIVGLSSVIADCRESRQLDQIYGQHPPLVLVTALRRLYRQLLQGVSNPVESIGLRMGWHDLCLQFLLSQSVDKASMRATANRPPAVPDNLPVCDETYSYTRTSVGRRILLHANAIRQLAEQFPFSAMTSPQFFIPRFCHVAALSLLGYIKGNKEKTGTHRTYDLTTREVDWDALGSFGFSPSDRLTSYDSHSSTSIDKEFISEGGIVELNGHPLQEEDLANFVIWLKSFGNIYGIAQVYSEDVSRLMDH
ncbi:hypothetical protein QFC22_005971 [Naganishia vaughanmartiniae]|uniref:Uncharacterized protein n=1 Tax=Naganishia vaughanmartiniae TaxID=1424756 RepID=A0ACC2WPV4_9TREE|nr:hypothetical protein QFC22_005971 [Naganishia vaughanmartiniae]